jgi:hypothetical protein
MLIPEVKTMGISRLQLDLDDIETVTLPIVFHVAHTGPTSETNISDEQILSQLETSSRLRLSLGAGILTSTSTTTLFLKSTVITGVTASKASHT